MKTPCTVVILLLFSNIPLMAQDDYLPGYIIMNSGDTVHGWIANGGVQRNAIRCYFKAEEHSSSGSEFRPDDIQGYRFNDGKYYISHRLPASMGSAVVFLEFLVNARIDMYYYRDESGDHYFADDGSVQDLVILQNYDRAVERDGQVFLEPSRQYVGALKYLFRESAASGRQAEHIPLNHKGIIRITKDYHHEVCKDEQCIVYEKKKNRVLISLGPVAALNLDFLYRISNDFEPDYYYFTGSKWKCTPDPSFGISMEMNIPAVNDRFTFRYDLMVARYSMNGNSDYCENVAGIHYISDINCVQSNLSNALLFRYQFTGGAIRPVISGGGFANWAFSTDYTRDLVVRWPSGDVFYTDTFHEDPFNSWVFGLTVGGGCDVHLGGNWWLHSDLRYSSGLGLFRYINMNMVSLFVSFPIPLNGLNH